MADWMSAASFMNLAAHPKAELESEVERPIDLQSKWGQFIAGDRYENTSIYSLISRDFTGVL